MGGINTWGTKMAKYVTGLLEKVKITADIVKQNGGIRGSLYQIYRTDALKNGTLVGEDKYGNKYYENNRYFVGRNRWIIFNDEKYHLTTMAPRFHQSGMVGSTTKLTFHPL